MQLSQVSNQGFRNLAPDPVSFGSGITLVTGENAQGKTNLLEAVAVVCGQRSFRNAASRDMARDGERFSVTAEIQRSSGSETMSVEWSRENGKEFRRSGKPAGFRDCSVLAPAVFLAPEHRELLSGSPAFRRRFLDRLVLGVRPAAGDDLARYATALRQRNALLARARHGEEPGAPGELEAWTEELCMAGAAVRRHRRAALPAWQREFGELTRLAGSDLSGIDVEYVGEGDTVEALRASCARLLPLERRRGYSLSGPHRDDLIWTRRGRPLSSEASSGEAARTVALARLAEWRTVAAATGEAPLFAADDFDAGLSEAWAEEFFAALPSRASVLLTTAGPSARWARKASAILEIRGGSASSSSRGILRAVPPQAGAR